MKNVSIIVLVNFIFFLAFAGCSGSKTESRETTSFGVTGVCVMCKERIESALKVKGVYSSDWDQEAQEVTVIYKPSLITVEEMHQLVANAGNDTEKVKAPDEAYDAIPGCCKYRDGVEPH